MKFRITVGLLVVAIAVLFSLVVKFSYDLKVSETELKKREIALEKSNIYLKLQKDTINDLYELTEKQLATLAKATDSIYYSVATKTNTFKSYKNYINIIGRDGEYYIKALTNMNAFFPKKGFVQLSESGGERYYTRFKDTLGFPKKPVEILGEPSVTQDNLYISLKSMNVRNGVIGNPEYQFPNDRRNGDVIWEGDIVKVLDIIESGSARWVYIAYGNK